MPQPRGGGRASTPLAPRRAPSREPGESRTRQPANQRADSGPIWRARQLPTGRSRAPCVARCSVFGSEVFRICHIFRSAAPPRRQASDWPVEGYAPAVAAVREKSPRGKLVGPRKPLRKTPVELCARAPVHYYLPSRCSAHAARRRELPRNPPFRHVRRTNDERNEPT